MSALQGRRGCAHAYPQRDRIPLRLGRICALPALWGLRPRFRCRWDRNGWTQLKAHVTRLCAGNSLPAGKQDFCEKEFPGTHELRFKKQNPSPYQDWVTLQGSFVLPTTPIWEQTKHMERGGASHRAFLSQDHQLLMRHS